MVVEGHLRSELVGAAPLSYRQGSVTTACQTDLSGEVSCFTGYSAIVARISVSEVTVDKDQ